MHDFCQIYVCEYDFKSGVVMDPMRQNESYLTELNSIIQRYINFWQFVKPSSPNGLTILELVWLSHESGRSGSPSKEG